MLPASWPTPQMLRMRCRTRFWMPLFECEQVVHPAGISCRSLRLGCTASVERRMDGIGVGLAEQIHDVARDIALLPPFGLFDIVWGPCQSV